MKPPACFALTADLTSAWTIPLVLPQAEYWGITTSNADRNFSGTIFVRFDALYLSKRIYMPENTWARCLVLVILLLCHFRDG